MTDTMPPSEDAALEEYPLDVLTAKDWMLEDLVAIFSGEGDNGRNAIGLTIQSNGASVSGLLISSGEWLERIGDTFAASPAPELKILAEAWVKTLENVNALQKERDQEGLTAPARRYIHMRDVRILTGNHWMDFPLWRGCLADVTGWSLGVIDRDA